MTKRRNTEKARETKKPQKMFDGPRYSLEIIPLNYRITIKLKKQAKFKSVDRDFYAPIELGIGFAKELAEHIIKEYFVE